MFLPLAFEFCFARQMFRKPFLIDHSGFVFIFHFSDHFFRKCHRSVQFQIAAALFAVFIHLFRGKLYRLQMDLSSHLYRTRLKNNIKFFQLLVMQFKKEPAFFFYLCLRILILHIDTFQMLDLTWNSVSTGILQVYFQRFHISCPSTHPADTEFPVNFRTLNKILRHALSSDQLFYRNRKPDIFFSTLYRINHQLLILFQLFRKLNFHLDADCIHQIQILKTLQGTDALLLLQIYLQRFPVQLRCCGMFLWPGTLQMIDSIICKVKSFLFYYEYFSLHSNSSLASFPVF